LVNNREKLTKDLDNLEYMSLVYCSNHSENKISIYKPTFAHNEAK